MAACSRPSVRHAQLIRVPGEGPTTNAAAISASWNVHDELGSCTREYAAEWTQSTCSACPDAMSALATCSCEMGLLQMLSTPQAGRLKSPILRATSAPFCG